MSSTQPARGMRDFLPADIRKREYVIGIIKEVYESYGFEPLETPAVENLETLTGKYGEEGNQLIYKILKRGEKLEEELRKLTEADNSQNPANSVNTANSLADLALRYDLTVPLARVVANNKNQLPKFFKRYQIQPVWRADRPARGRFREFYQCDVDATGSSSMIVEAELISAVCDVLTRLGFDDFELRINHRELLFALLRSFDIPDEAHANALVTLDKIDKIGEIEFKQQFSKLGISEDSTKKLMTAMEFFIKNSAEKGLAEKQKLNLLEFLKFEKQLETKTETSIENAISIHVDAAGHSEIEKGIDLPKNVARNVNSFLELYSIFRDSNRGTEATKFLEKLWRIIFESGHAKNIKVDPTLARGLSYYTGVIFEVVLTKGDFDGSIAGGGRYDGLIGMFGKEQIPACGFSLGLERIIVVMEERGMFQKLIDEGKLKLDSADVMVTIWNEESVAESLKLASELRAQGLRVLVYPEADKLAKQFKYASQINIPFVCVIGESELAENKVTLKNMTSGEQETVNRAEVAKRLRR